MTGIGGLGELVLSSPKRVRARAACGGAQGASMEASRKWAGCPGAGRVTAHPCAPPEMSAFDP